MSPAPSILCAVDLSDHSGLVLQTAGAVADHFAARLVITTVARTQSVLQEHVQALARQALPHHRAARVEYRVAAGPASPACTILRLAVEENADLIVIGTRAPGGLRKRLFGSTAEAVLRGTVRPTLVVPRHARGLQTLEDLKRLGSVLAPTDLSEPSRREVGVAAGLARALSVPLLIAHVLPVGSAFIEDDRRWLVREARARASLETLRGQIGDGAIELLLRSGSPPEEIAQVAADRQVGFVLMGLRRRELSSDPPPGSIANRVLSLRPTLLLALPRTPATPSTPVRRPDAELAPPLIGATV